MSKLLNPVNLVLGITALHFFAEILFGLLSITPYDYDTEPGLSIAETIWQALRYPVASATFEDRLLREAFPGPFGHVPAVANSFLWGIVFGTPIYLLLYWWRGDEKPMEQA